MVLTFFGQVGYGMCDYFLLYSIIKGSTYNLFNPSRVLRQGYPLSPYLFILVTKTLSRDFILVAKTLSRDISKSRRTTRIKGKEYLRNSHNYFSYMMFHYSILD